MQQAAQGCGFERATTLGDNTRSNAGTDIVAIQPVQTACLAAEESRLAKSPADYGKSDSCKAEVDPNYWTTGLDREIRFEC